MVFRRLTSFLIFLLTAHCYATDGQINFVGRVVESTCSVQIDKTDTNASNNCTTGPTAKAVVKTQVIAPASNMVVWHSDGSVEPDNPSTKWKVTKVTYW